MNELPYDMINYILDYLAPKTPKSSFDLESYKELTPVNKDFHRFIVPKKKFYIELKEDLKIFKDTHKCSYISVLAELKDKVDVIIPHFTKEECLVCKTYLPCWWPLINSSNNYKLRYSEETKNWMDQTKGLIEYGLCGQCFNPKILCKECLIRFPFDNPTFTLAYNYDKGCEACVIFRDCDSCHKLLHPLIVEDNQYSYCSTKCKKFLEDLLFFQAMNENRFFF
jgi:hypothetical protein